MRSPALSISSSAVSGAVLSRLGGFARPIAQNDRPHEDRFRAYIGSMIGIGSPAFRERRHRSQISPSCEYAGLLAARVKSASRLRSSSRAFSASRVEIDEFVGVWLMLDESERSVLGAGATAALGSRLHAGIEHVQRQRQISHPRLCARLRALRAVSARLAARRPDRRRGLSLSRRRIRLGYGVGHSRRRDHGRRASGWAPSSAGRAGWRRTGRRPSRRSAATRGFIVVSRVAREPARNDC